MSKNFYLYSVIKQDAWYRPQYKNFFLKNKIFIGRWSELIKKILKESVIELGQDVEHQYHLKMLY